MFPCFDCFSLINDVDLFIVFILNVFIGHIFIFREMPIQVLCSFLIEFFIPH